MVGFVVIVTISMVDTKQPTSLCDAYKRQNGMYFFAVHQWYFFFSPDMPDEIIEMNKEENMAQGDQPNVFFDTWL